MRLWPPEGNRVSVNDSVPPFVFVVSGDPAAADSLAALLNRSGFEAISLHSGRQLLDAALTLRPDLLITDSSLGDMSGFDAALGLCRAAPECRTILLSSEAAADDRKDQAGRENRPFEILSKPVQPETLLARLRLLA